VSAAAARTGSRSGSSRTEQLRLALATALIAAAATHLAPLTDHLHEAPWMGWLFVAFIGAALGSAAGTLLTSTTWPPKASIALTLAALATYCATRLLPLPQLADDVGDWLDPWGLTSVALELTALVIAVQLHRLAARESASTRTV
jgi:hypothetical protein